MTNAEIDIAEAAFIDLLKVGAAFYPPLAVAVPVITKIILLGTASIKTGIANGTIIPDGQGGLIPSHGQSYYDPATGIFTGQKT